MEVIEASVFERPRNKEDGVEDGAEDEPPPSRDNVGCEVDILGACAKLEYIGVADRSTSIACGVPRLPAGSSVGMSSGAGIGKPRAAATN